MLISEKKFKSLLKEETKKFLKEAAPAGATTSWPPAAGTPERAPYEKAVQRLNAIFTQVISVMNANKPQGASAFTTNWSRIKTNGAPALSPEILDQIVRSVGVEEPRGAALLFSALSGQWNNGWITRRDPTDSILVQIGVPRQQQTQILTFSKQTNIPNLLYYVLSGENEQNKATVQALRQEVQSAQPAAAKTAPAAAATSAATSATPAATSAAPAAAVTPAATANVTIKQGDTVSKLLQTYYGFNPMSYYLITSAESKTLQKLFKTADLFNIQAGAQIQLPASIGLAGKNYIIRTPQKAQSPAAPMVGR